MSDTTSEPSSKQPAIDHENNVWALYVKGLDYDKSLVRGARKTEKPKVVHFSHKQLRALGA